ncbi:MAG: NADH-quinone oxidoreductase subunit K [Candidatus Omnitrophica bacterium]|jgi:NADH:ubiquinone oxidoreductase subunit K|nr:NADH-quinone oxidoreductase subunit K [Candidatus Omnitrophota bacterium]
MSVEALQMFWPFLLFVIMLFIIGIYCILITFNLIRALLGVEILIKAVTLLIVIAGFVSGHTALAQTIVITLIVVEAVSIAVAVGIVLGIHSHNNSLDVRRLLDTDK